MPIALAAALALALVALMPSTTGAADYPPKDARYHSYPEMVSHIKEVAAAHPDIVHDAAHPDTPRTAFGAMIAGLKRRRADGTGPFTGQSCDNLQGNGAILRQTIVSLARLSDPDLADWIDANASFPNSMVDCIVPATGPKELELVRTFGIDDAAPVTHENFRQWVIEDDFCAGRPDWDKAGATFSDDVHAFEAMKIRILNGGHQVISDPGEILSVATIAGCMAHPLIGPFFRKVAGTEIAPHVAPVPGMTPQAYVELIERRFANPEIVSYLQLRTVDFPGKKAATGRVIYPIYNHNRMVINRFDGVLGGKSGYTSLARRTMVAAAERDGRRLIVTLLNIGGNTYTTPGVLLDWGFANADKLSPVGKLPEPSAPAPQFDRAIMELPAAGKAPVNRDVAVEAAAADAPTAPDQPWTLGVPSLPGLPSPLTVLTLMAGVLVLLRARVYWIAHRSRTAWTSLDHWASVQARSSRRQGPSDRRVRPARATAAGRDDTLISASK